MAKKEIRMITASEDVANIIDQGAEVDTELKNLTFQDKALKGKITAASESLFEPGESSVRVQGTKSKAVVTAVSKNVLNESSHEFHLVEDALKKGLLSDVVKESRSLNIPNDKLDEALVALKAAGINATISESYTLDSQVYGEFSVGSSPERAAAKKALDDCVSSSTSYRIKYEENK